MASPPYGEIVARLTQSTMRAMAEFLSHKATGGLEPGIPDARLNRHFLWMDPGRRPIRHLFDGGVGKTPRGKHPGPEFSPLRTLKARRLADKHLRKRLTDEFKPGSEVDPILAPYIQDKPTRISQLIRHSIFKRIRDVNALGEWKPTLPSPIAIVRDFLTIPDVPASRAYATIPVRNLLYEILIKEIEQTQPLDADAIEEAYSNIGTYTRRRYFSSGVDTLPSTAGVDGFVRHCLAADGIFLLRFDSLDECHDYLVGNEIHPTHRKLFEFYRSPQLQKLPELEEVINSIAGLALPIRGADTLFRGGLRFPSSKGLVCALHGGPGTGKTSLSLAIAASLAPLGVGTVFLTAEEREPDLRARTNGLLPSEVRRLPFVSRDSKKWLEIIELKKRAEFSANPLGSITSSLANIAELIRQSSLPEGSDGVPMPCRAVVVLDGLHDLLAREIFSNKEDRSDFRQIQSILHSFIDECRQLEALVILTTGTNWKADESLDYLVDVAMRLSHDTIAQSGSKPDRMLTLIKTRHQFGAPGSHEIQISGEKGVRFTPQMNYQIDRRSIWTSRLPDQSVWNRVMQVRVNTDKVGSIPDAIDAPIPRGVTTAALPDDTLAFRQSANPDVSRGVRIFRGSNIFLHGEGSGGKAGLALKIAVAPYFAIEEGVERFVFTNEKILVVSFLYPEAYYNELLRKLVRLRTREYEKLLPAGSMSRPRVEVIHLYPGDLRPDALFNRIEWSLEAAELNGCPFSCVVIDGIHNVFLQFPEIEKYGLFWPQLYSALRTRDINIITTHTMLSLEGERGESRYVIDDRRSDPLRHALVQKTDFRFDVYIAPYSSNGLDDPELALYEKDDGRAVHAGTHFIVHTVSAIGQSLPGRRGDVCWSREKMVFFECPQMVTVPK